MNIDQINAPTRQAVINGLAAVGFVALVAAGIWLAVYSTRFVPTVVNRIGAAAVYLGSAFTPSSKPTLSVVPIPAASTTIPFSSVDSAAFTNAGSAPTGKKPASGAKTNGTYQIGGAQANAFSGLPDLAVNITAVGYLETASADSFVASSSVPYGSRPAIKFTIKNLGTNWTGTWRFNASIPAQVSYVFQSDPQQSLAPGDSIDYTLGFDRASTGADQAISVTVNSDNAVADANANNNSDSKKITVLGS